MILNDTDKLIRSKNQAIEQGDVMISILARRLGADYVTCAAYYRVASDDYVTWMVAVDGSCYWGHYGLKTSQEAYRDVMSRVYGNALAA